MKVVKIFAIAFSMVLVNCASKQESISKINGVSLVASRDSLQKTQAMALKNIHTNTVALMPFGFLRSLEHPEVVYSDEKQWFGERKEGIAQYARELNSLGMECMLKPQIWVWDGKFTGDIKMKTEKDWKRLEDSYESFILFFAEVGESLNIKYFCIGTELHSFALERPAFFKELIVKIRQRYSGELTYAENWDSYQKISFWGDLDFIGIDAYFPLSKVKTPSVAVLSDNWKTYKKQMKSLSETFNKPILFTEYGYRSSDYAAKAPWEHHRSTTKANHTAQSNALEALYQTFWKEPWFAGGFLWKWFPDLNAGGLDDNRFTIQNKPALKVVAKYYSEDR
ncbi:glycoside hydrolase [Galbibacter sp. BG1]|uniref:glycoside hydrolase family 113 n=1 Tax=Galbibacter sp. BG1 TaxID=1170699 RepID=UPI0015BC878D|nr:glycoside hydrolase [Galbibacter sp. BG1]QLE00789.1 glycoside hydrolase [Galbibacter sp. BG1]